MLRHRGWWRGAITQLGIDTVRQRPLGLGHKTSPAAPSRASGDQTIAKDGGVKSSHALQTIADGLPALGIVAAVLGVIKTMGSIDQPPEILGKLIGGALVGTFLGVFLAYGLVGPFASKVKTVTEDDGHFHQLIREVLVANLHNHPPNICIEVGRQNTPSHCRPDFATLEEALKEVKKDAA